jgi:ABC-2 type transport system permease protein
MENLSTVEKSLSQTSDELRNASNTKEGAESEIVGLSLRISDTENMLNNLSSGFSQIRENLRDINVIDPEKVISPVKTEVKPTLQDKRYIFYLFPSLLVLVIMFMGLLLSSAFVLNERASRAYHRNLIAPIGDKIMLAGELIFMLLIILLQTIVVLLIGSLFYNIPFFSNALTILPVCLVLSFVFILMGFIIGYIFNSAETGAIASISMSCILFLFSTSILPLEKMSVQLSKIAQFNPFIIGEGILKRVIFFGADISTVGGNIWILLIFVMALLPILIYLQYASIKKMRE